MKKALFACFLIVACMFSFVSCSSEPEHEHVWQLNEEDGSLICECGEVYVGPYYGTVDEKGIVTVKKALTNENISVSTDLEGTIVIKTEDCSSLYLNAPNADCYLYGSTVSFYLDDAKRVYHFNEIADDWIDYQLRFYVRDEEGHVKYSYPGEELLKNAIEFDWAEYFEDEGVTPASGANLEMNGKFEVDDYEIVYTTTSFNTDVWFEDFARFLGALPKVEEEIGDIMFDGEVYDIDNTVSLLNKGKYPNYSAWKRADYTYKTADNNLKKAMQNSVSTNKDISQFSFTLLNSSKSYTVDVKIVFDYKTALKNALDFDWRTIDYVTDVAKTADADPANNRLVEGKYNYSGTFNAEIRNGEIYYTYKLYQADLKEQDGAQLDLEQAKTYDFARLFGAFYNTADVKELTDENDNLYEWCVDNSELSNNNIGSNWKYQDATIMSVVTNEQDYRVIIDDMHVNFVIDSPV